MTQQVENTMKKIIILCIISLQVSAGDLIYKNSFEDAGLVSGTASGIIATGLSAYLYHGIARNLQLRGAEVALNIDADGTFIFATEIPVGNGWTVIINTLPDNPQKQSCTITNYTGTMTNAGVDTLRIVCDTTQWNWDEMNWEEGGWN